MELRHTLLLSTEMETKKYYKLTLTPITPSKEIRMLRTDQFEWKTFMSGPFEGRNYIEVDLPWDKTCKASLSNTNMRILQKDYQKPILIEDPTNPLDEYTFLTFMF